MLDRKLLREVVDGMDKAVSELAVNGGISEDVSHVAKGELLMFLMYLAASDGKISWEEAEYIADVCDTHGTPNQIGKAIRDDNLYSREFEQKVPVCLKLSACFDKAVMNNCEGFFGKASYAIIEAFRRVGAGIIMLNTPPNENSVRDHRIYIHMMEKYRDSMLGPSPDASGFVKDNTDYATGFEKHCYFSRRRCRICGVEKLEN